MHRRGREACSTPWSKQLDTSQNRRERENRAGGPKSQDEEHVAAGRPCRASFADTTTGSSGAGPESRDASLSSETDVDINRSMKPCGLPTSKTAPSATYFQNQRLVTAAISAAVAGNPRLRYPGHDKFECICFARSWFVNRITSGDLLGF